MAELLQLALQVLHALVLPLAIACASSVHALLDATFGDKALLEEEQIVGDHLIREAAEGDSHIGQVLVR